MWNRLTHHQRARILGPIVLLSLFGCVYGGLSDTKLGAVVYLTGLLLLTVLSPIWGFSLGRIHTGRGDKTN